MASNKGHNFRAYHFHSPTWCEVCKKFIWGLGKQGLKCRNCDLAIHKTKCIEHVPKCSGTQQHSPEKLSSGPQLTQNTDTATAPIGTHSFRRGSTGPIPSVSLSTPPPDKRKSLSMAALHAFTPHHFNKPTWCSLCGKFIWGVSGKQGYRCSQCKMAIHKMGRCMDLLLTDPKKATCTKACGDEDEEEDNEEDGNLPVNVMFHIFSFLSNTDVANLALVSRYYLSIVIEWRNATQSVTATPTTSIQTLGTTSLHTSSLLNAVNPSSVSLRKKQRMTKNIQRMLVITIAEAKDLATKSSTELADPYVSIRLDNHQRRKTKIVHGTIFPVWQEAFTYLLSGESTLLVKVWDWNLLVKKKFLGCVTIPLEEFKTKDMSKDCWYRLCPKSKPGKSRTVSSVTGEIRVIVECKPFAISDSTTVMSTIDNDEDVSLEKSFRDRRMRILETPVTGASMSRRRLFGVNAQKFGSGFGLKTSNEGQTKTESDPGPMRKTVVQSALSFKKTTKVTSLVASAELNVDEDVDSSPPIPSTIVAAEPTKPKDIEKLSDGTTGNVYAAVYGTSPIPKIKVNELSNSYSDIDEDLPPKDDRIYGAACDGPIYGTPGPLYGSAPSGQIYGTSPEGPVYGTAGPVYGTVGPVYGTPSGNVYSTNSSTKSSADHPDLLPISTGPPPPLQVSLSYGDNLNSGSDDKDKDNELNSNLGDWNFRYQRIMLLLRKLSEHNASFQEEIEVRRSLVQLSQDFLYTAKAYGKIIISEVYLPVKQKTIKPVDVGGIAGGEKYIIHNILFKFAVDDKGVYGGNDAAAAKAAGHDLKGLQSYVNCDIPGICTPFMVLVDYRGFRLIAMSILPIEKSTLIYGSANAGKTVYNEDHKVDRMMRLASKILNLKPHVIEGKTMHSAVDLEGHRGKDGCFYLVDFSRVLPPESPRRDIRNAKLFRLLRPEFVRSYTKPLCSDAFSPCTKTEKEHNEEVVAATEYLINTTIPRSAKELCVIFEESKDTQVRISEALHSRGINLRYLGLILKAVEKNSTPHPNLSILLVIEMVARIIKNNLRTKLREKMKELRIPVEEPYRRLVVEYLNLVFGKTQQSDLYWNNSIRSDVKRYFQDFMLKAEDEFGFSLKKLVTSFHSPITHQSGTEILFGRIRRLSGLKFSSFFEKELLENPEKLHEETPFDELDLDEIGERIKHMNTVQQAEGYMLLIKGVMHRATNSTAAKRSFNLAIEKFQEALDSNSNSKVILRDCAQTMVYLYKEIADKTNTNPDRTLLKQAHNYYARAVEIDTSDSKSLMKYARFIEEFHTNTTPSTELNQAEADRELSANLNLAEEYYLQALENDPDFRDCLISYGQFLDAKRNDPETAEKFYLRARAAFVLEEQRQQQLLTKAQEKTKKKYQMKVFRK